MRVQGDDTVADAPDAVHHPTAAVWLSDDLNFIALLKDRYPHPGLDRLAVELKFEQICFFGGIHCHGTRSCRDAAEAHQASSDGSCIHARPVTRRKDEVPTTPLFVQILNAAA
jgi:hypothetical protein